MTIPELMLGERWRGGIELGPDDPPKKEVYGPRFEKAKGKTLPDSYSRKIA